MNAIEVRRVTKTFGSVTAVKDLSFSVPRGSIFGFIGPNGSGKTTTLRMITNIFLPDSGEIAVLGRTSSRSRRDEVGYLPEERGLYRKMTVRRLLTYYGQLKGVPNAKLKAGTKRWLEKMGLAVFADKNIETLSKGMAQKVQFVAAVISEPELVILDEPFSGLDPVNAEVLKEAVLELKQRGTTVLFSTHDMSMAERLCDRICMVFKGTKVLDGTLDDIQASHGQDTVRVRTSAGLLALDGLVGVSAVNDHGNFQELKVKGDAQQVLRQLVERTSVQQFEIVRPSLHDIFVGIARPEGSVYHHA